MIITDNGVKFYSIEDNRNSGVIRIGKTRMLMLGLNNMQRHGISIAMEVSWCRIKELRTMKPGDCCEKCHV